MTIYLVQHGKSVSKEENPERPLSPQGMQDVEQIALRMAELNIRVRSIYHTNKLRAIQTAEILHKAVNASQGMNKITGMNPNDDVQVFARNIEENEQAMYVGHLPFMEKLVSYLVTGAEEKLVFKFQNAGIIKLELSKDYNNWYISGALLPKGL